MQYIGTKVIEGSPRPEGAGCDVTYPDTGYKSWSPIRTIVSNYRPLDQMTFGQAMEALRLGHQVRRAAWPTTTIVYRETYSTGVVRSQIYQKMLWEPQVKHYLYAPTQQDMVCEDWLVVTPENQREMTLQGSSLK